MRSMPVAESATPCHASPAPRPERRIVGSRTTREGMTMFNTRGTHLGASHSALYSATHAHTHSNRGEIILPVTPARAHAVFFRAVFLRLTALLRSTALLVWALTASCFAIAQDTTSRTSTDEREVEELHVP